MKNKDELIAANEEYKRTLTKGVDEAQEELIRVAKKALLAGGIVLTISMVRNAFFVKTKKDKSYKKVKSRGSYLSNELSHMVIMEVLKLARKSLATFLEEHKNAQK